MFVRSEELLPEKVSKRSLGRLDAVLATSGSSGLPNRPYENMASSVFAWSSHSDRAAGFCLDFDNINSLSKVRSRLHPSVDYSDLDCALKSHKAITFITLFTTRFQEVPKNRELSEFQRLSKILGTIIIQHGNPLFLGLFPEDSPMSRAFCRAEAGSMPTLSELLTQSSDSPAALDVALKALGMGSMWDRCGIQGHGLHGAMIHKYHKLQPLGDEVF